MKSTSIEALNRHLFETIEMLKNNSDPNASPNEKVDVETAKTIANLGHVIVEGYKTQVQAVAIMVKADNKDTNDHITSMGLLPEKTTK